jgi:tRNA(His) guanylyltransferase
MSYDNFSIRMKDYESREISRKFIPLLPIYARIDGRSFSNFTNGLDRPYDIDLSNIMIDTTKYLVKETNARIGYTQSDEISLVWLADSYDSEIMFDGKIQKMVSILAGMTSSYFTYVCLNSLKLRECVASRLPMFDCRVFQFPNRIEATNCILWRERDATKNAISMAARHYFSHKELQFKKGSEMQEMLFQKGVNFNDYPAFFKRGTFVRRKSVERLIGNDIFMRTEIVTLDMPSFGKVINRDSVVFDGAEPIVGEENEENIITVNVC